MKDHEVRPRDTSAGDPEIETPRGTLAIMVIFGLLFALAWLGTYIFLFLGRGAVHSH